MPHDYRVIPAPRRAARHRGARRPEDRFARSVEQAINGMASQGWEFVRSDTLPCERRVGWFGRRETTFETVLVFRREAPPREAAHESPLRATPVAEPPRLASPMPPPIQAQPPFAAAPDPAPADPAPGEDVPQIVAQRAAPPAWPAAPVLRPSRPDAAGEPAPRRADPEP